MRAKWLFFAIVVLTGGGFFLWWTRAEAAPPKWKTAAVQRGDLVMTITATGTIEPEEVVDVGAQVAGLIKGFGEDPNNPGKLIDYGSQVDVGTVLVQIDDDIYQARVERAKSLVAQAEAQIAQAKADCQRAEADLLQVLAKHRQADREWKRSQQLAATGAVSDAEYDLARADFETAEANLAVYRAAIDQAKANLVRYEKGLAAVQAELREAEQNLAYTTIRSPVKGVIVDRRVNTGQTVVANLNAPSLFLIAKDLRKLEVWASVNEADIGQIAKGQKVRFTVDAYPGRTFVGDVGQIRLNATMTQNVVTYTVVVKTDNADGKLLPYQTANLQFEVARVDDALLVPNASLRFRPKPERILPAERENAEQMFAAKSSNSSSRWIWIPAGSFVRPVPVQTGLSDAASTEIKSGEIKEGEKVVIGEEQPAVDDANVSSPFAPKMFGNKPKQ